MRLKWAGLILLFGFWVVSCATDTGPRFVDLRANKQQQIQQELETTWPRYIIYYIPEHAVLFDLKEDGNTLVVSSRWVKFDVDKNTWVKILRQNTQTTDSLFDSLLQTNTGFLEIIGPDEQFFGYLVHKKMDLVALKVIDRNTMRIYYAPQRTEGR